MIALRSEGCVLVGILGTILAASTPASAQATLQSELRWGGAILDVVLSPDSTEVWTAEDGGRIRNASFPAVLQQFQNVPAAVKDSIQRVHFLADGLHGWAVEQNGWVLRTLDGGAQWQTIFRMPAFTAGGPPWEELWDVHFVDESFGVLVGLHWMWTTIDGGSNWTPVTLLDADGTPFPYDGLELYCVDLVHRPGGVGDPPGGTLLGLAGAEPGVVFKSTDLFIWQVVFDARSLCPSGLPACADAICDAAMPGEEAAYFEPWDIEISRHATNKLALVVGGVGTDCGLVFRSTDDGASWVNEPHECKCPGQPGCIDCSSDPLYNNDPSVNTDTWRLKKFSTLYGVGILDGDNSAVACGYSGQHVVRDPVLGVWRDRSSYSNDPFHAIGAVTIPLLGADAGRGDATSGRAMIAGEGGFLRASINGGQTWANATLGEPWRVRDVHFFDLTRGWMVGQFFRLASTLDGGRTWTPAAPEPEFATGFLNALDFAGGIVGVAVGDVDHRPGPFEGKPKILITQDGGLTPWVEPTYYQIRPFTNASTLREVEYAGGTEWWAVGDAGLILHSVDHGQSWYQYGPPDFTYPDLAAIDFNSVSFSSPGFGMFVGYKPGLGRGIRAVAYTYKLVGGNVTWLDVTPSDTTISILTDVAVSNNQAYVVGERLVHGKPYGVFLSSLASGGQTSGNFAQLALTNGVPQFPACTAGSDLESIPVLNEVEIAPDGDVWVAGECGRTWQLTPPGLWVQHKSDTDSHVRGMSFPLPDVGYLGCHRASTTGWSIVRFRP